MLTGASRTAKDRSTKRRKLVEPERVALEELLASPKVEERFRAAEALGQLLRSSGKAPKTLIQRVNDRSMLVRASTVESLGYIEDPRASRALIGALKDASPIVRSFAAASLGFIGGRTNVQHLLRAQLLERSARARVGIAEGLIWQRERVGLEVLLLLMESRQYRVRCAAANALSTVPIGPRDRARAATAISQALADETTVAARSSLERAAKALQRHLTRQLKRANRRRAIT